MLSSTSESELRTGEQGPVRAAVPSKGEAEIEVLDVGASTDTPHSGLPPQAQSVLVAPLHNDRAPHWSVAIERPEHRMCIILKAEGYSHVEIGSLTGLGKSTVSNVLRQPWARVALLALMAEMRSERLAEFFKREAVNSLATLVEIRDTAPKAADRLRAATELVNRYLGKPTERVEVTNRPASSLDEVNQEIAALEQEEAALIGKRS